MTRYFENAPPIQSPALTKGSERSLDLPKWGRKQKKGGGAEKHKEKHGD